MNNWIKETIIGFIGISILSSIILLFVWGCPKYNIWKEDLKAQAELKRAQWINQVSKEVAEARIKRAEAISEANRIIGLSFERHGKNLEHIDIDNSNDEKDDGIFEPKSE